MFDGSSPPPPPPAWPNAADQKLAEDMINNNEIRGDQNILARNEYRVPRRKTQMRKCTHTQSIDQNTALTLATARQHHTQLESATQTQTQLNYCLNIFLVLARLDKYD